MNINQFTEEYIQAVRHEIELLSDDYTGNLEFRFNFKEGSVANMNCSKSKSLKLNSDKNATSQKIYTLDKR